MSNETTRLDIDALKNCTPGPWDWTHSELGKHTALVTPDRGRLVVMDLARAGMQGAEPRFAHWAGLDEGAPRGRQGGILQAGTDHVDARAIRAAPLMVAEIIEHRAERAELVAALKAFLTPGFVGFGSRIDSASYDVAVRNARELLIRSGDL